MKKTGLLLIVLLLVALDSCKDTPINNPPSCRFISPMNNSSFFQNESINISVDASDAEGMVSGVEILFEGNSIVTLNTTPYEYSFELLAVGPGEYILKAVSSDDKGETSSSEVNIIILPEPDEFTDPRDGNVYRYVEIGTQTWMVDNLAYLSEVHRLDDSSTSDPRYYVFGYDGTDTATAKLTDDYVNTGALYNFEAAKIACPEGWHLPDVMEWDQLLDYIATNHEDVALIPEPRGNIWLSIGKYLRSTNGWRPVNANGLNTYGFSAIPSGAESFGIDFLYCQPCNKEDDVASWWSSSSVDFKHAYAFDTSTEFMDKHESARKKDHHKVFGLSVRCVKDDL